ncbi:MAG: HD domain-containing protein [Firmicutes bacterium]|nr:HD domain-containing protein [Bacillota bacterium]MBR6584732.1 HD domain-containing protein [Bacillota bacterium]
MENNSRLLKLQNLILEYIDQQEGKVTDRDETLNWERIHMASAGQLAWAMALERGTDPDLAACAASIHDIGRITTGRKAGHAEAGYEPAKRLLAASCLFTEEEVEIIAQAVKNHSSKDVIGTVIEEIVKDADVVDCCQHGFMSYYKPEVMERFYQWEAKCRGRE